MSLAVHPCSEGSIFGDRVHQSIRPTSTRSVQYGHARVFCLKSVERQLPPVKQERLKLSDLPFTHHRGNKRWPLTDDGARRIIKDRASWESQLRKNQPGANARKWIRRSPSEMEQFLANGRVNHRFNKRVSKALHTIRMLATKAKTSYDFGMVMNPWVGLLSFKDMCIILREQKHWLQACNFFHWMKLQGSYTPSVIPYTIVVRLCGEAGKLDLVEKYYQEMLDTGCEPDEVIICSLICVFAKSGQMDNMMDFYCMMRTQDLIPPIVVLNFMISSLYKAGSYNDVIEVWKDMMAAKVKPNEYTYAVVVNAYKKEGKFVEALQVFEEMVQEGHLPDEVLCNIVLKMMGDLGREESVIELYKRMKVLGLVIGKHTYTYLVHFFSTVGKYEVAVSFFSEMQSRGIPADEVIYGTIITIYGKLGMLEDAELAFKEMDKAGLAVTERIFIMMASVRVKAGNFSSALQLLDEMQARGFEMTKYGWIIVLQCCLKQQKVANVESAFRTMVDHGFADALSYVWMFNFYKKMKLCEAGRALLLTLEAASDVERNEELLGTIVAYASEAGWLQQAEYYFSLMEMKGFIASRAVKTELMRAYASAGRLVDAESLYLSLGNSDAMLMEVMFSIYASFRKKEAAMNVSRQLLQTSVDDYNKIIFKSAKQGYLSIASSLCSQMMSHGLIPKEDAFLLVIDKLSRNKRWKESLDLIECGGRFGMCFSPAICKRITEICAMCGQENKINCLLGIIREVG